jgi:hypothetical protein
VSCGGGHANANYRHISEVCSEFDNVTIEDGRTAFHRLADEHRPAAEREYTELTGKPRESFTRDDLKEITDLAHQKARWALRSDLDALSTRRHHPAEEWIGSPDGRRAFNDLRTRDFTSSLTHSELRDALAEDARDQIRRATEYASPHEATRITEKILGQMSGPVRVVTGSREATDYDYQRAYPTVTQRAKEATARIAQEQARRAREAREAWLATRPTLAERLGGKRPATIAATDLNVGQRVYPIDVGGGADWPAPRPYTLNAALDTRDERTDPHEYLGLVEKVTGETGSFQITSPVLQFRNITTGETREITTSRYTPLGSIHLLTDPT